MNFMQLKLYFCVGVIRISILRSQILTQRFRLKWRAILQFYSRQESELRLIFESVSLKAKKRQDKKDVCVDSFLEVKIIFCVSSKFVSQRLKIVTKWLGRPAADGRRRK